MLCPSFVFLVLSWSLICFDLLTCVAAVSPADVSFLSAPQHQQNCRHHWNTAQREICAQYPFLSTSQECAQTALWAEIMKNFTHLLFYASFCASVFWSFLNSCADIIMGTHKEGGATTFWSYILNLPLSSNSMVSWKFCYLLHKVLRDGHRNVSLTLHPLDLFGFRLCLLSLWSHLFVSDLQAVRDSHRYCRNIKDMGVLWVSNWKIPN